MHSMNPLSRSLKIMVCNFEVKHIGTSVLQRHKNVIFFAYSLGVNIESCSVYIYITISSAGVWLVRVFEDQKAMEQ